MKCDQNSFIPSEYCVSVCNSYHVAVVVVVAVDVAFVLVAWAFDCAASYLCPSFLRAAVAVVVVAADAENERFAMFK